MKLSLDAAAFDDHPVDNGGAQTAFCDGLLQAAQQLAAG